MFGQLLLLLLAFAGGFGLQGYLKRQQGKQMADALCTAERRIRELEDSLANQASTTDQAESADQGTYFLGRPVFPNDLTLIWSIDSSTSGLLNKAGILTWNDMAAYSVDDLRALILSAADQSRDFVEKIEIEQMRAIFLQSSLALRNLDVSSWPKQAELAQAGKWDELEALQNELKSKSTAGESAG